MTIEALLGKYGLVAVFLGAGIEGEAAVVASGVLSRHGLFPVAAAMAAAAIGSFVADQLWFLVGRRARGTRIVQRARASPRFAKAIRFFDRHPRAFIFAFRFVYGFRTISPIAIGTTDVPARLFVIVNFVSAIVWGIVFIGIGYLFGHQVERLIARLLPDRAAIAGAFAVAAVVALVVGGFVLRRRRDRIVTQDAP